MTDRAAEFACCRRSDSNDDDNDSDNKHAQEPPSGQPSSRAGCAEVWPEGIHLSQMPCHSEAAAEEIKPGLI